MKQRQIQGKTAENFRFQAKSLFAQAQIETQNNIALGFNFRKMRKDAMLAGVDQRNIALNLLQINACGSQLFCSQTIADCVLADIISCWKNYTFAEAGFRLFLLKQCSWRRALFDLDRSL